MSATLDNIFNRMSAAQSYRPGNTTIFDDVSLEAGDIISISSDGEEHPTVLSTMDLVWNGSAMVSVNSQGQEKRDSLTEMSRRKFNGEMGGSGGGYGYRNTHKMYTDIIQNDAYIRLVAQKTGIDGLDEGETLFSQIEVAAEGIRLESERAQGAESNLRGAINVQAGKISLVVSETSGGNVINAASIITAINDDGSSIDLNANKITLDGNLNLSQVLYTDNTGAILNTSLVSTRGIVIDDSILFKGSGASQYSSLGLQTVTIDGTEQTAKFLGTSPLAFSVADTEICQALVSAAGQITAKWSQIHAGDTYSPVYTASTSQDSESITVGVTSNGWAGVSSRHPGSCIVYATAGGGNRAHVSISGDEPYQAGYTDGLADGGSTPSVVSGAWNDATYTVTGGSNTLSTTVAFANGGWVGPDEEKEEPENHYTRDIIVKADNTDVVLKDVISASSVYDTGKNAGITVGRNNVSFNKPTFSGDTYNVEYRTMTEHISNGKTQDIKMRVTHGDWYNLNTTEPKIKAWLDTCDPGSSSYLARMNIIISGKEAYKAGLTAGQASYTISGWDRDNFPTDTSSKPADEKKLTIKVYCKVNGHQETHTFTTAAVRVWNYSTFCIVKCGSVTIAKLYYAN